MLNFKKYRRLYADSHRFFGDQIENDDFNKKFWDLRNQILEDYGPYYGAIDYELIHKEENLYENAMNFFNHTLENRDENTFIFFLSHYNPEREAVLKIQKYYEYTMNNHGESLMDGILVLPVLLVKQHL